MADGQREVPRLSYSIAKVLLSRSRAHAWQAHRLLGGCLKDEDEDGKKKARMEKGLLIEACLGLGDMGRLSVHDFPAWQSNAAKEAKALAYARGEIPVLAHKHEAAMKAANEIKASLAKKGISLEGKTQTRIEWDSPSPQNPSAPGVPCSGYTDLLQFTDEAVITDLKVVDNASPAAMVKTAINLGYHVQRASYVEAISALYPKFAGRVRYRLIACEPYAPWVCMAYEFDGAFAELGERQWRRAVEAWGLSLATDRWPDYGPGTVRLAAPSWAISQEMEALMDEADGE